MKSLREFTEVVSEGTKIEQAHERLKKIKKGTSMSFTHAQSGKKITGTFKGIKNRGGRPYAHIEVSGEGAYHVPVHQVD